MNSLRSVGLSLLLCSVGYLAQPSSTSSQTPAVKPDTTRDGQHDFDYEIGTWKIHLSRLQDRLDRKSVV